MDLRRYSKEARLFATNSSAILAAIVPRDAIGDLATTTARVARLTARDRARRSVIGGSDRAAADEPSAPMQPSVVSGPEAEDVLKLLASSSAGLPRMLPELESYRPASTSP